MGALRKFVQQLQGLSDPALHASAVADFLALPDAEALVEDLAEILRRTTDEPYRVAMDSLTDAFVATALPPFTYDRAEEIYRIAESRGLRAVALLFLNPPPQRAVVEGWRGDPDPEILDLTLGEQKSLARRQNSDTLARVARLTEPSVLRILLGNPRLTETDVVAMAARRPNAVPVLTEVMRSRRWRAAALVRLALVHNPYLPPRLAVLLVPNLASQELVALARAADLHPLVVEMARAVLDLRKT